MKLLRKGGKFSVNNFVSTPIKIGSPRYQGSVQKIVDQACKEAEIYAKCNVGGVLVENMNDIPYVKVDFIKAETVAVMSRVCSSVREILPNSISCGIQVLAGGNNQALAIALACGYDFIRVEGFVFGHLADEGYIDACAGSLLRYRNDMKSNDIRIFTDIKKKHSSHAVTADLKIADVAKAAEFFLSDGVIVTGASTGKEVVDEDFTNVKNSVQIPVIIGSGVTDKNVDKYLTADALIIGSHFKRQGRWQNEINEDRITSFLNKYYSLQS